MPSNNSREIPEDVWAAAQEIDIWFPDGERGRHVGLIARAILAERERCAKVAESISIGGDPRETSLSGREIAAIDAITLLIKGNIASAIRRGSSNG